MIDGYQQTSDNFPSHYHQHNDNSQRHTSVAVPCHRDPGDCVGNQHFFSVDVFGCTIQRGCFFYYSLVIMRYLILCLIKHMSHQLVVLNLPQRSFLTRNFIKNKLNYIETIFFPALKFHQRSNVHYQLRMQNKIRQIYWIFPLNNGL